MGNKGPYHGLIRLAGLAMVLLIMAAAAVFVRNAQAFRRAEEAFHHNALQRAAADYERTIRWYLPFNGRVRIAVERLWQIGRQAETEGNVELAGDTYRRLRSSLLAVHSFYQPYADWIGRCDARLERIDASTLQRSHKTGPRGDDSPRKQGKLPHAGWAFAMQIGFWGWIVTTVALIMPGSEHHQKPKRISSLGRVGLSAGLYAVWLLSMANA